MNPIHKITGKLARTSRKTRIVGAGALALALCAFGAVATAPVVQDDSDVRVVSVAENLALPNLSDQIAALQQDEQQFIHEERVRSGDSIGTMLARLGVNDAQAQNFIRSDKLARRILSLKNGKRLQAETDENGELLTLRATLTDKDSAPTTLTIARHGDGFKASEAPAKLERRVEMRSRQITSSSLYSATDANVDGGSIPDSIVGEIIKRPEARRPF
jgi:hypothetical protein